MTRGVKAGTRRGHYNRFNKARLRKLAQDMLLGNMDRQAVAQAFNSTGRAPDQVIAAQIQAGLQFDISRLAQALICLGEPSKSAKPPKAVPIWMAKAAIKHRNGMKLSDALGLDEDYSEHKKWRAYHRQLNTDYGSRSARSIDHKINRLWPQRKRGQFPGLEQAIRSALHGEGIPLALHRAWVQRDFWDQVEGKILKNRVI